MFKKEDIESIDRKYFTVIVANEYDIILVSNNTHHVWYIHNVELPDRELCIVFHKHKPSHPYHNHSRCGTLRKAIKVTKAKLKEKIDGIVASIMALDRCLRNHRVSRREAFTMRGDCWCFRMFCAGE